MRLLISQFRRAIRCRRGVSRSDRRYWSSTAGSEPKKAFASAQTASVQTRNEPTACYFFRA